MSKRDIGQEIEEVIQTIILPSVLRRSNRRQAMIYLLCKHTEVTMYRKVFRTGNSLVISLPREALEYLDIQEGTEIELNLDRENHQMIIKPVEIPLANSGIDEKFALQVAEFIDQYRPALQELAK